MPTMDSATPARSNGSSTGFRYSGMSAFAVSNSTISTGTLMRNTEPHQ
ncbi:Uncharacterised protein [Mycobacteroides abscessus subsp. massiliense]|nr:Uncharacterised protein [Mycobacteroides abscessus subsp. massiliense]